MIASLALLLSPPVFYNDHPSVVLKSGPNLPPIRRGQSPHLQAMVAEPIAQTDLDHIWQHLHIAKVLGHYTMNAEQMTAPVGTKGILNLAPSSYIPNGTCIEMQPLSAILVRFASTSGRTPKFIVVFTISDVSGVGSAPLSVGEIAIKGKSKGTMFPIKPGRYTTDYDSKRDFAADCQFANSKGYICISQVDVYEVQRS